MKKLLLLAFILLPAKQIVACSYAGGEITYRSIGNGVYEVNFIFYHNLSGVNPPTFFLMQLESNCGYPVQTCSLQMVSSVPFPVYPSCQAEPAGCTNLPNYNYKINKYLYQSFVVLPALCEQWTFSVIFGQRNPILTTIDFPVYHYPNSHYTSIFYYPFYVYATINYSDSLNNRNNSPLFLNDPEFFACKDEVKNINPRVIDPDGDSIVCSLINPLGGPNIPVDYKPGYSSLNPFSSNPPITFDQSTGNMLCKPVQRDFTVLAYEVSEYRNGKIIGRVVRDFNLLIEDCRNNYPELSGFLNLPVYTLSICAGQQTCLPIYSTDDDSCDSTFISWDHGIPGATFITSAKKFDEGLFCWRPGFGDISNIPYTFSATVADNKCKEKGIKKFNYSIFVVAPDASCLTMTTEKNISNPNALNIFPQPAIDIIYIDLGNELIPYNNYAITISNILGETIFQSKADKQVMPVELPSNTPAGIYPVVVTDQTGRVIKKDKIIYSR